MRAKRGLSETLAEILLIAVTIAALGFAISYYTYSSSVEKSGEAQLAKQAIYKAGQQLVLIYYATNSTSSLFYVVNIGNIPIQVSSIVISNVTSSSLKNIVGTIIWGNNMKIYKYESSGPVIDYTIDPNYIYLVCVPYPNVSEITLNASGINYIVVTA